MKKVKEIEETVGNWKYLFMLFGYIFSGWVVVSGLPFLQQYIYSLSFQPFLKTLLFYFVVGLVASLAGMLGIVLLFYVLLKLNLIPWRYK